MIPEAFNDFKSFLIKTQFIVSELSDSQYQDLKLSLQIGRLYKGNPKKNEILQSRLNEVNTYIDADSGDWSEVKEEQ